MKKTAISLGLAGILLGNTFAQNEEKVNADLPKIEIQKTNSLDSLVKIYNTPASIQRYVAQNIEYIKDAEKFYPEINKNSASKGFIRFPSPEKILEKKYGDCEEGFVLTASALKKLGYETSGIIMMPKNGEAGHIFTIYQDSITKLYGTAGISIEDYISPLYNSIDSLVAGLALKSQYDDFKITGVKVTDDILSNQKAFVDLPKQYVKDMNLTDIFGVMFKTENTQFGKLNKNIYEDNYSITLGNTIIETKNPVGDIKGPILRARINWGQEYKVLGISYNNDHRYSSGIAFYFKEDKLNFIELDEIDRAKNKVSRMEQYSDELLDGSFCEMLKENPKCITKEEISKYMDLVNYFLTLMKDKETRELWEQTKKQREINQAKQDSLKINFPRD